MLGYSLGNLLRDVESIKNTALLGSLSAIRRVSTVENDHESVNEIILQEYVRVLQGQSISDGNSKGEMEQYIHKAPLYHVFGEDTSNHHRIISPTSSATSNPNSKSSVASQYDIEISLDSIHITGFTAADIEGNNSKLLKRDSLTLYLTMSIENSILNDMLGKGSVHSGSTMTSLSSSLTTITIKLHYIPSIMTWVLIPSTESSLSSKSSPNESWTALTLNSSYLDTILYCELWYKTLIRRNRVVLGVAHIPLGGLDHKETELRQQIEVQNNNIHCQQNARIELQVEMKLKQKKESGNK